MRKLKLELDELEVESFSVLHSSGKAGTVHGQLQYLDPYESVDYCRGGGGATGPSNPVCIGPTYCCNPTANTGCCPPPTGGCPETAYFDTCHASCPPELCSW